MMKSMTEFSILIGYKVDTEINRLIYFEYPAEAACCSGINIE